MSDSQQWYRPIGKRIERARKEVGLTQEELALAVKLSKQSISNIENGRHRIQLDTLDAIAGVLGRTLQELLPGGAQTRQSHDKGKAGGDSATLEDHLPEGISDEDRRWVLRVGRREDSERFPPTQLAQLHWRYSTDETRLVSQLLKRASVFDPPVPVADLPGLYGALLRSEPAGSDIAGMLLWRESRIIIGVNSSLERVRQRFAIAHELGHLAFDHRQVLHLDRHFTTRYLPLSDSVEEEEKAHERIANSFALRLLVPPQMLRSRIRGIDLDIENDYRIDEIAEEFEVSRQIMTLCLAFAIRRSLIPERDRP